MSSDPTKPDRFGDYLGRLGAVRTQAEAEQRVQLEQMYGNWADTFNLLKRQFGGAWGLFGEIQDRVTGWRREGSGQWGYVGATGYGYYFSAELVADSGPQKRINVEYGTLRTTLSSFPGDRSYGIGDERLIGRRTPLTDTLTGLDDSDYTLEQKLRGAERLSHHFSTLLIEAQSGEKFWSNMYLLRVLERHELRKVLEALFVGITIDEVVEPDLSAVGENVTLALQSPAILDAK